MGRVARERKQRAKKETLDSKFIQSEPDMSTMITYEQAKSKFKECTREQYDSFIADVMKDELFVSSTHQVSVRESSVGLVHLSMKRLDKEPMGDWRIKQLIKNVICGDESEAVEIFPPESELVDGANQYHLWVLPVGERIPFGFKEGRNVSDEIAGNEKQREGVDLRTHKTGLYKRKHKGGSDD